MSALPLPSGQGVLNTDVNPMLLGWVDFSWFASTLAYVSADSPTFVFSVNADVTAVIEPGMRVKLTQTTDKFFIVTAVGAFAAGVTPVTVYGGTDYTLANAAISAGSFSTHKKPFGFNTNPAKWTQELRDTSDRAVATPTANVWTNPGSLSLSIPIGVWRVLYQAAVDAATSSNTGAAAVTLSTANNSQSDADLTAGINYDMPNGSLFATTTVSREKLVTLAAKTSYFLNIAALAASQTSIAVEGSSISPTIIRAVCAYL